MKKQIYLYFVLKKEWKTLLVNETMCFRFLLSCILEKKEVSEVVYEYTTNTSCDLDLSLHALKIQNGMSFKIY